MGCGECRGCRQIGGDGGCATHGSCPETGPGVRHPAPSPLARRSTCFSCLGSLQEVKEAVLYLPQEAQGFGWARGAGACVRYAGAGSASAGCSSAAGGGGSTSSRGGEGGGDGAATRAGPSAAGQGRAAALQLPGPWPRRPGLGTRLLVQQNFGGLVPALVAELGAWQEELRLRWVSCWGCFVGGGGGGWPAQVRLRRADGVVAWHGTQGSGRMAWPDGVRPLHCMALCCRAAKLLAVCLVAVEAAAAHHLAVLLPPLCKVGRCHGMQAAAAVGLLLPPLLDCRCCCR